MAKFFYKARKGPTKLEQGTIEAESQSAAVHKLTQMGFYPIKVSLESEARDELVKKISFFKKIRHRDTTLFSRQLSNLISSGLTLSRALTLLHKQTENRQLQTVIQDIGDLVKEGRSLSDSLSRYPQVFDSIYVNMVRSGELSGTLEKVLSRLASFGEKREDFLAKVKAAMVYPILIFLVGIGTVVFLFTFVIPNLVELFEEMGRIPVPTQILIAVSNLFVRFWWLILAVALVAYFAFRRNLFSVKGRLRLDNFRLNIPVMGKFFKTVQIASFSRTLGTLLANGVPILQAMNSVRQTVGSEMLKQDVQMLAKEIKEGSTLARALRKSKYFPVLVSNMLTVGEESGKLDAALVKVAETYEKETDQTTRIFTSLLEPVMILVIGGIVGFIVISMLLPIFQISLIAR